MTVQVLAGSYFSSVYDWLTDPSHWRGSDGVPHRLLEHVQISVVSLLCAVLIALPIGLVLGHYRKGGFAAVNVANVGRAIPALSILLLAVLVFGIGNPPKVLTSIGVGSVPAFIALVALAIPPILTNAYVAVAGVDPAARDAARGMGMNDAQMLVRVELPLASRLVMAGVRTSAVAVIATATLLAYVGGGGLGRFIIDGAAIDYSDPRIFVGALFVALLSIAVELVLALLEHFLVPKSLRRPVDVMPEPRLRIAA